MGSHPLQGIISSSLFLICLLSAQLSLAAINYEQLNKDLDKLKPDHVIPITFCVFDPIGKFGEAYSQAQDMVLEARKFNLDVSLKLYTSEKVATEDFKAGQCDGAAISTLRAKQFNLFMGSIDSIGSIPDMDHMRTLLHTLANPKILPYTISGRYQVLGIVPLGAAYVFVNDRTINSVEAAAGKKIAVLGWDPSQSEMVKLMGGSPVSSNIANFGSKFNNGVVDIIVAPALAYKPFELYKGLGEKGGIYRFPVAMMTGALVINRERMLKKFPEMDSQILALRDYALAGLEEVFSRLAEIETEVESHHWMELSPEEKIRYTEMMRQVRIQMTKKGYYDPKMMSILKRVRCSHTPDNAECTMNDE
ncbi:MAG: DUF6091 family protein [Pseudomonadales bacterium]|nr:DUF6091 family protein [Pseudomonadales bacterium]